MEKTTFNHDGIEMYESFNLTKEQADRLESAIVFESIVARSIIKHDYNGEERTAPRALRTKTGVLARSLKYANTEMEKLFLTFLFHTRAELANTVIAASEAFNEASQDYQMRVKLIEAAQNHFGDKMSREAIERHLDNMMEKQARPLKPFRKLVRQVENSNYDFHLFNAMIDEDEASSYVMDVLESSMDGIKRLKDEGMFKMSSDEDED